MKRLKYIFHSTIEKNTDGIYYIYFPILKSGGCGLRTLDDSVEFASDLLSEMILAIDPETVNKLQDEDRKKYGNDNDLFQIQADITSYCERVDSDEKRSFDDSHSNEFKFINAAEIEARHGAEGLKSISKERIISNLLNYTKHILIALIILCFTIGIVAANGIKTRNREQKIQESIQKSRTYISSQDYKQGYTTLSDLKDNPEAGDYTIEIESLYDYALLKDNRDEDGGDLTIEDQYQYSQNIKFDTGDELYKDAEELKEQIKKEYDVEQQRLAEEEAKQAAITEANEAKKRKEYLEKLATTIPFEGMESQYVDCTKCGAHHYEENELSGMLIDYDLLCYWQTETENWLRVYIKDKEVIKVEELVQHHNYWDEKGFPKVEELKKAQPTIIDEYGSERDSVVDTYWTGKEYADHFVDDYVNNLKKDNKYSSLDEKEIEVLAWVHAFDHWLNNQKIDYYDTNDYYDTIENSDN